MPQWEEAGTVESYLKAVQERCCKASWAAYHRLGRVAACPKVYYDRTVHSQTYRWAVKHNSKGDKPVTE